MTPSRKLLIFVALFTLVALVPAAVAGSARFVPVNYPGAVATYALGINAAGDIVGAFNDSNGKQHGFLLHAGVFTSFDYPGAVWTEAFGVTARSEIVGQYGLADNTTHGFLLRIGESELEEENGAEDQPPVLHFYPIDVPGPTDAGLPNTMPFAISRRGKIVGCYHEGTPSGGVVAGTMRGFVLTASGVAFDSLAGTMHTGVNSSGEITGYSSDGRSYVISNGTGERMWFTYPGASLTRALGISATGDIVGWYRDAVASKIHGFLLQDGEASAVDVDLPGVTQTRVSGINAAGDIVGYYVDATGVHGYLRTKRGEE